ncbi:hypothetical protein [Pseudomonas sp. S2_A02]
MFQLSYLWLWLWLVWQVLSYDFEGWRTLLVATHLAQQQCLQLLPGHPAFKCATA